MLLNTRKKRLAQESYPLARKRAAMLSAGELYNASEGTLYSIGASLSAWRRGGGEQALDEVENNILALLEVCRELRAREARS